MEHHGTKIALATGVAAGLALALTAGLPASAAGSPHALTGAARATVGSNQVRIAVGVFENSQLTGAVSYYDGRHWLTSTRPVGLKVLGRMARVKGEGTWNGQHVAYYFQVKDRSPKRADYFSMKIKSGKSVVLKQAGPINSGGLVIAP